MHFNFRRIQGGFTLVELLVVMLVLVALSSITLDFTKDFAFQGRYEVTKDRYDKIKRAIIGRPDVLINGQPDISGFVADMGRLPDNMRELFQSGYCVTAGGAAPADLIAKYRPSSCTGDWKWSVTKCSDNVSTKEVACVGGHRWLGQKISSGLKYGWSGRYISTEKDYSSKKALNDGWGTESDNLNYGWNFSNVLPDTNLILNSLGKGAGTDIYDADYPSTNHTAIDYSNWTTSVTGIQVNALASGISSSIPCAGIPFNTDLIACEMGGGHWDGACSPTVTYTTRYQCEVVNGETWTPTNNCSSSPTVPSTKYGCENLGGNWTSDNSDICLKIYYKKIDAVSGELLIDRPLVSAVKTIREDGGVSLISFDGFFSDLNDNGIKDGADIDFATVPIGQIKLSLNTYDTATSTCTATRYNSGSDVLISVFKASLLPVINW